MNRTSVLPAVVGVMLTILAPGEGSAKPTMPAADPASVTDRAYYPAGYRDLRIAARAQIMTFPRPKEVVLMSFDDDPQVYDVIDCNAEAVDPANTDRVVARYGDLALQVSRIEVELARFGYRREIWEQPLSAYERAALERFAADEPPTASEEFEREPGVDDFEAPPDDATSTATDEAGFEPEPDRLTLLAREMEARRARLQSRMPPIVSEGGCGAGEGEFTIKMEPPSGRLWLINAFAFRVCERKFADPWDHRACSWSEYGAGDEATASGRYIYEARWPDGTVRRGARILEGGYDPDDDLIEITFKRN